MSSVWLGWASYLGSLHDANRSCSMHIFLAAAALWRRGGRYGSKGGCYRRDRQTDGHEISAGIIQGSGIGPASYVVNSSDLTAVRPGNLLCKYADDTYLIIPSITVDTRLDELANVEEWSRKNNLTLNRSKSHLAHKAFRPCEYFGHTAWQPAQFTWSSSEAHLCRVIVVRLYNGRGSSTTGIGHSSRHPFWTLRSWSHVSRRFSNWRWW